MRFVTKELRAELRETYGSGNYRITANGEIHYKRDAGWLFLCRLSDYQSGGQFARWQDA